MRAAPITIMKLWWFNWASNILVMLIKREAAVQLFFLCNACPLESYFLHHCLNDSKPAFYCFVYTSLHLWPIFLFMARTEVDKIWSHMTVSIIFLWKIPGKWHYHTCQATWIKSSILCFRFWTFILGKRIILGNNNWVWL